MNKRIKKKKGHYKCKTCGSHKEYIGKKYVANIKKRTKRACFNCAFEKMWDGLKNSEEVEDEG